jgi:acyl-CoA dehydrogenase
MDEMIEVFNKILDYMHSRNAFRKSIAKFQVLRRRLVDLATRMEAIKILMYLTTKRFVDGEVVVIECEM